MAKTKAHQDLTPRQRRQQIIDILLQTLAGKSKPAKKLNITRKFSQKALA